MIRRDTQTGRQRDRERLLLPLQLLHLFLGSFLLVPPLHQENPFLLLFILSAMSSALNAGAGGGGSPPLTKESELTAEESAEFSDTLKSLETTMKLHMSVLSVKRGLGAGGGVGGTAAADDPSSVAAVTAPAGGLMAPAPPPRSLSRLRRESTRVNGVSMPNRTDKVSPTTHVHHRLMSLC